MKLTKSEEKELKKAGWDEDEEDQEIKTYKKLYDHSEQWFKEHPMAGSIIRLILSITGHEVKKEKK